LLEGLQGLAAKNGEKQVTAGDIIDYVRDNVPKLTSNKQHPRDFGSIENATRLSDISKQGINLTRFKTLWDSRNGEPLYLADAGPQQNVLPPQVTQDVDAFRAAVTARRLLPTDQGTAWDLLAKLRAELPPGQVLIEENVLRVALEDQAQQVL